MRLLQRNWLDQSSVLSEAYKKVRGTTTMQEGYTAQEEERQLSWMTLATLCGSV